MVTAVKQIFLISVKAVSVTGDYSNAVKYSGEERVSVTC